MSSLITSRRNFIKSSASAVALISFPGLVLGQNLPRIRLEWQQFKTTAQYTQFLDAVKRMRANTTASSPASWTYWVNAHVNYCPHGTAYFLAWHRGYLYYFEQELRKMYPDLTLPYWDYYRYPRMPAEFTDSATGNPLYMARTGTNVYTSLTLAPFSSKVVNFQRGTSNAFETSFESKPHNPVHNLIGGEMAKMTSPNDPIFFLHHCNIDRLWYAWVRAGGKRVPYTSNPYNSSTSNSYWAGLFRYGSTITLERYKTYTPSWLGYDNANNSQPTSLPPSAQASSPFKLTQAQTPQFLTRPAVGNFPASAARAITATSRSLGGVTGVTLTEASVSARLPISGSNAQAVQNAVTAALSAPAQVAAGTPRSVKVVLENLQLLGAGAKGGYFYNIFINLPLSGDATGGEKYLLGTVGPFEIAGASHHGSPILEFPATEVLSEFSAAELKEFTVSFERVSGENAPRGQVLRIGEVRIEISTEAPWNDNP